MKKLKIFCAANVCVFGWVLGGGAVAVAQVHSCEDPKPTKCQVTGQVYGPAVSLSAWGQFPIQPAVVESWVANRMGPKTREHGYYLWAGLNQTTPNEWPVWRTWDTVTQVMAPPPNTPVALTKVFRPRTLNAMNAANAELGGAEPINFQDVTIYEIPDCLKTIYQKCGIITPGSGDTPASFEDGPTLQNNGDILVAGVIYNDIAAQFIRQNKLYEASQLNQWLPKTPQGQTSIGEFPFGSVVLKPMQWPVQGEGFTALPMWDDVWPPVDHDRYAGYEIQGLWPRAVAITADASAPANQDVEFLYGVKKIFFEDGKKVIRKIGPNVYRQARVVSVNDFYHHRYSQDELDAMDSRDRAILDSAAYWCYKRPFQAGDYLVTVAMHIMTKEQPAWTFQSVWWHDHSGKSRYSSDQPQIPGADSQVWKNYRLTSTYGIKQRNGQKHQWPRGVDVSNKWPVAYNPYIELAAAHPIVTNCMNCHHRGAWPSRMAQQAVESSYLKKRPGLPDALDSFKNDNSLFDGLLRMDAQWALSDRAK